MSSSTSNTADLAQGAFDEKAARARIKASAAFQISADQWNEGVAALGLPDDPPTPTGLWAKLDAQIDALTPPHHGSLTVRADDGAWEDLYPGVTKRQLYADPGQGWRAVMIRMAPGATYPAHAHAGVEECLVLEGEFEFDDLTVRQGDFHLAFPDRDHPESFSRAGALLYIRSAIAA